MSLETSYFNSYHTAISCHVDVGIYSRDWLNCKICIHYEVPEHAPFLPLTPNPPVAATVWLRVEILQKDAAPKLIRRGILCLKAELAINVKGGWKYLHWLPAFATASMGFSGDLACAPFYIESYREHRSNLPASIFLPLFKLRGAVGAE